MEAGQLLQLLTADDETGGGFAVLGQATIGADRVCRMGTFDAGAACEPDEKERKK
jgi:hypothetical protein